MQILRRPVRSGEPREVRGFAEGKQRHGACEGQSHQYRAGGATPHEKKEGKR